MPKGTVRRRGSAAALTKKGVASLAEAAPFRVYFAGIAALRKALAFANIDARIEPSSR